MYNCNEMAIMMPPPKYVAINCNTTIKSAVKQPKTTNKNTYTAHVDNI